MKINSIIKVCGSIQADDISNFRATCVSGAKLMNVSIPLPLDFASKKTFYFQNTGRTKSTRATP